jgi:cysteinyl-tRNA synthetase
MTNKKEDFSPITEGKIKMYACGPTVYNYFHIGNARPFLFFDLVKRYFEYKKYEVIYVQNITDIDDKIINKANEENVSTDKIAAKFIKAFYEDTAELGIRKPDFQPLATEYINKMIELISKLENKGYAYEVNGDVYFSVSTFIEYGKLSGKKLKDLQAGARVEENSNKKNSFDFTLWKKAKEEEPNWDSPWGKGRPGWHTECVVMSQSLLGDTFDIHGGGVDLIFPHHENEIAQGEAVTGKPLANYWMHNGFLNIKGEKMSKSLGNFFTTRDILKLYDAEAIRMFFLSKHYRSPIDFSEDLIKEALRAVENFYATLKRFGYSDFNSDFDDTYFDEHYRKLFEEAMDDDFNTAKAIAVLFDLNKTIKLDSTPEERRKKLIITLVNLGKVLGFFKDIESKLNAETSGLNNKLIELLIRIRNKARKNKNWQLSDEIRDELKKIGVELNDTKSGTDWNLTN